MPHHSGAELPGAQALRQMAAQSDSRGLFSDRAPDPAYAGLFLNRELSWLAFDRRVLAEAADETREALLAEYRAAVAAGPLSAEVEALQSIKGCGFALAAAFASEVGDFSRFRSGRQVTAYFGLAPSQRSSGDSVRLGGISGAGNALVRKLAVEGSWCYAAARHQPKLMPRDTGVPLEIRMHGRKGSERLLRRREEMIARGMPQAKANAATAAELVRWLWALGTMCREGAE